MSVIYLVNFLYLFTAHILTNNKKPDEKINLRQKNILKFI